MKTSETGCWTVKRSLTSHTFPKSEHLKSTWVKPGAAFNVSSNCTQLLKINKMVRICLSWNHVSGSCRKPPQDTHASTMAFFPFLTPIVTAIKTDLWNVRHILLSSQCLWPTDWGGGSLLQCCGSSKFSFTNYTRNTLMSDSMLKSPNL